MDMSEDIIKYPGDIRIDTRIKLNNGLEMPLFGLGTYEADIGKNARNAVLYALEIGYRLFDTARIYGNEREIGEALRESEVPRDEVFITTKLWNSDHGYENAIEACERSLRRLGLSYVDLYLIHWPEEGLRNESWRALETLLEKGKCLAIGVSNYMIWHLEELLANSSTVPAVNQVEFSPFLYQKELLEFCHSHSIWLEGYSPLTNGAKLGDRRLIEVAKKYSKTPAQILIRWGLQRGVITIPKSSNRNRIRENAEVFDFVISEKDMTALDAFNVNLRTSWDPSKAP